MPKRRNGRQQAAAAAKADGARAWRASSSALDTGAELGGAPGRRSIRGAENGPERQTAAMTCLARIGGEDTEWQAARVRVCGMERKAASPPPPPPHLRIRSDCPSPAAPAPSAESGAAAAAAAGGSRLRSTSSIEATCAPAEWPRRAMFDGSPPKRATPPAAHQASASATSCARRSREDGGSSGGGGGAPSLYAHVRGQGAAQEAAEAARSPAARD